MSKITSSIIKLKLKDIIPYENNPKIHTEKQIADIRDSIISLGYLHKIEVDENNIILAGHGRLKGLYQIDSTGEKEVEVIKYLNLSESVKIAYRIAHNKLNLDTGFDEKILGLEFNILEDTDLLTSTGFSLQEITKIWDKKMSTTEILEQDKTTVIQHTCPSCGHNWEEEFKKSRKKE